RLDVLLALTQLASPGVDPAEQDGAVVVAEVAEQPPEPLGTAERAVRDDEDACPDPGAAGARGELLGGRKRVTSCVRYRELREIRVDVEERRGRDVAGEVEPAASRRAC